MIEMKQPLNQNSDETIVYIKLTDCIDRIWGDYVDSTLLRKNGKPIWKDKDSLQNHLTNAHAKGNLECSHQESKGARNIWVEQDCVEDYISEVVKMHEENNRDSGVLFIKKGLIAPARFPKFNDSKKIAQTVDSLLEADKMPRRTVKREGPSVFSRAIVASRKAVTSGCNAVTSGCNAVGDATKRAVTATRNAIAKPFRAIAETIESNEDKGE